MERPLSPMMTSIEGAERLPDADYSVPHRAAPPTPTTTAHSSTSSTLSALPQWPTATHHGRHASDDTTTTTTGNSYRISNSSAGSAGSQRRKREGSFGILRRGKNSSKDIEISSPIQESAPTSPISPSHSPSRANAQLPRRSNDHEEAATMFRSRSRNKKQEPEIALPPPPPVPVSPPLQQQQYQHQQQQREQQQQPTAPHRFPPNHPLAGIQPPNGIPQDVRPDSIALFNQNSYVHGPAATQSFKPPLSGHPQSPPPQAPPPAPPAANFSRPGLPAAVYHSNSNKTSPNMSQQQQQQFSSSPAYAIRQGNAFAAQASSSPSVEGGVGGTKEYVNTYAEPPSMANRGRFISVSTVATTINVNSPRRIRRRKDPTAFNILVIGAKNVGKSSFISFLKHSLATPTNRSSHFSDSSAHVQTSSNSAFTPHYLETDLDGERVAVTLWDSPGLEKSIVDLQMREMATFVEAKFEETFAEEQKVSRTPGVRDTHIHCVFLLLDPSRLDLTVNSSRATQNGPGNFTEDVALENAMDLQVIQALWGKTAVIPVIAKADTVTSDHMAFLKRAVWKNLKSAKLDPLEVLDVDDDEDEEEEEASATGTFLDEDDDDEDDSESGLPRSRSMPNGHKRASSIMASIPADETTPYIPMSILSPDPSELANQTSKKEKIGRRFPWGFADPNDAQHCDFPRLRDTFFHEWRVELRDLSRSKWYEDWRTSRLKNKPLSKSRQRILSAGSSNAPIPSDTRSHTSSNVSPTMSPTMSPSMQPQNFYADVPTPNIHTADIAIAPMAMSAVPRTVMNGAGPPSNDARPGAGNAFAGNMSKAERMMGMSPGEARNIRTAHGQPGGTYRGVETYQQ